MSTHRSVSVAVASAHDESSTGTDGSAHATIPAPRPQYYAATSGTARLADILSVGSGRALVHTRPALAAGADADKSHRLLGELETAGAAEMAEVLRNLRHAHPDLDLISEYAPPDAAAVAQYRNERHPRALPEPGDPAGSGALLPLCATSTGAFPAPCVAPRGGLIRFGAGVSAYFRFLKLLMCMYATLFVLTLPSTATNAVVGDYFRGGFAIAGTTTLGNMFVPAWRGGSGNATGGASRYELATEFLCVADAAPGSDAACETDSDELSVFYAVVDAIAGAAFLGFAALARAGTRREKERFRRLVQRVEHYSVAVRPLPRDCSRDVLRGHFEGLVGKVHDVQLVSSTGDELALVVRRGKQIQRLARADAHRRRARPGSVAALRAERRFDAILKSVVALDLMDGRSGDAENENGDVERGRRRPQQLLSAASQSFRLRGGSTGARPGQAQSAFVSFEREADRDRCLRLYDQPSCGMRQARELCLGGEHELKVAPAPPPSALLWENSDASGAGRALRLLATALALLVLLAAHVGLNRLAQPFKLSRNYFDVAVTGAGGLAPCQGVVDGFTNFSAASQAALAFGELPGGVAAIDCLCEALFSGSLDLQDPAGAEEAMCGDYRMRRLRNLGVQIVMAAVVLLINLAAYLLMSRAARGMRHASVIARDRTVLRGVFVLAFFNTALVLLLLHADLSGAIASAQLRELLGDGRFIDFSPAWYRLAGFELLLLGLGNVFAPHLLTLGEAAVARARRAWAPRDADATSLAEARERAVGPEFALSFRLAQALFTVYFTLAFSAGLPVLYAFGAMSAGVAYAVDKWMFLRVCRAPETPSAALQDWVNGAMPWAVVVHVFMSVWMISGPAVFPSSEAPVVDALALSPGWFNQNTGSVFEEAQSRFARRSAVPPLLLLGAFLGGKLLMSCGARAERGQRACMHVLWRCVRSSRKRLGGHGGMAGADGDGRSTRAWAEPPTLTEARQSGALAGLPSYFILENPTYKRYFPDLNQERAVNDELRSNVPGIAP